MTNVVTFAVGCFMFENRKADLQTFENSAGEYRIQHWASEVQALLQSIDGVGNVVFDKPTGITGTISARSIYEIPAELVARRESNPSLLTEEAFVPNPSKGSLSFDVSISHSRQVALFKSREAMRSERFSVTMRFGHGFPVTFIKPELREPHPASATIFVREFLKKEVPRNIVPGSGITFSNLGPSPFHANFLLKLESPNADPWVSSDTGVTGAVIPRLGYDSFVISGTADDLDNFYEVAIKELTPPLGLYYSLVSQRNMLKLSSRLLTSRIDELISLYRRRGLKAWLTRSYRAGRDSLELKLELLHTAGRHAAIRSSTADRVADIKRISSLRILDNALENEIPDPEMNDYPGLIEMVNAISTRQSQSAQTFWLLVASLVGALVGVGLAAIFGG